MLTGLIGEHPSAVRSAALRAVASSLTASRLAADHLAAMMDDPELGAVAAARQILAAVPVLRDYPTQGARSALLKITSDRAVAERYLAGCPEEPRRGRFASELLTWLAEHGGLTTRQHTLDGS
jgi:hypothetical protein